MVLHISKAYNRKNYINNNNQDTTIVSSNIETTSTTNTTSASTVLQMLFSSFGNQQYTMNYASDRADGDGGAASQHVDTEHEDDENPSTKTPEEAVKQILKDFESDIDNKNGAITDDMFKDIVKKYRTIKSVTPNITEEQLNKRIVNYTNALIFHQVDVHDSSSTTNLIEYQSKCSEAKTEEELIEKYQQFGTEYVELYDNDGNGSIELHELFYQSLIDNYIQTGTSREKAVQNAIRVTEEYKQYNLNNLPSDNKPETEIFLMCANKLSYIDTTTGATTDGSVSSKEAAAYLLSTAQLVDNKNNIKSAEFKLSEYAIAYSDPNNTPTIEQLKADIPGCDDIMAKAILNAIPKLRNNMNGAMSMLNK